MICEYVNQCTKLTTLDPGIDVGQEIKVGHGKFGKTLRSFVMKKLEIIIFSISDTKSNKHRAFQ